MKKKLMGGIPMFTEKILFPTGGRSNYRIPSIVVTKNGTAIAFCNDRKDSVIDHAEEVALVCAVKKPGGDWSEVKTLAGIPGWACGIGSAVYDPVTATVMCSAGRNPVAKNEFGKYTREELADMERRAEEKARELGIRRGGFMICTSDGGDTWFERPFSVKTTSFTREDGAAIQIGGGCHGSAHGICLKHGEHKGRLICPSRFAAAEYNTWDGIRKYCYNNAVYSDDRGETWQASAPVQRGTGEGTLIELGNGRLLYNSRAYFQDQRRLLADSCDGGETWGNFRPDGFLLEEKNIGCNASFLRVEREDLKDAHLLPDGCEAVTIFANPRAETRRNMTCCVSFDDGETWAVTKMVWENAAAYSSLDYDPVSGRFFLLYERGDGDNPYESGIAVAEFDLDWLLGGND